MSNWVYGLIATRLTAMENQRTQAAYDSSLALKTFSFELINAYAPLVYIAFLPRDGYCNCEGAAVRYELAGPAGSVWAALARAPETLLVPCER